ncbi:hypothetical protein MMU05_14240 [Aquiflexum sp. AIY15W]|nr:hypothetical protein [Cognataquiflexum rubidum]MCH6235122.1 hypothetical protein [Cognataquiflexum rubidum]
MKSLKTTFLFLLIVLVNGCYPQEDANDKQEAESGFTFMTSPDDRMILSYIDPEGNIFDVWGDKDSQGKPVSIDQITIKSKGDTTQLLINEAGNPVQIFTQEGVVFSFDWISEVEGSLSVLSSDGLEQINTQINLGNHTEGNSGNENNLRKTVGSIRKGKPIKLELKGENSSKDRVISENSLGNLNVYVNSCNAPSNLDNMLVIVRNKSGEIIDRFPTKQIGNGHYVTNIPLGVGAYKPSEYFNSATELIDKLCIVDQQIPDYAEFAAAEVICAQLSMAFVASGIGTPFALQALTACAGLALTYKAICTINDAIKLSNLANSEFLNRKIQEDIVIYAKVFSAIPYKESQRITVTSFPPFPDLYVDLGSKVDLKSLTINPIYPKAGEDYFAISSFKCLEVGSLVKMSVLGSDGYEDSISFNISTSQSGGEFKLQVPGADTGVQDVITLEVSDILGKVLERKASIVFN